MAVFDWKKLVSEMSSRCPFLLDLLLVVMKKTKEDLHDILPRLGLCYSILMQTRNRELSLVQRLNTVLMTNGNAKKELFRQCQKMGFSLSHQSKTNLLDIIGSHFSDSVVKAVKDGKNLQGTGDNWDMKIHVHDMQSSHQNQDLHYFASNLIVERVPCQNLSSTAPQRDITKLSNSIFLLSDEEEIKLREDFKVLVGRVLVTGIQSLSFLKSVIPEHIPHKYQKEMSEKSIIVPLPMQLKDEKKYSVVDILDYYENELEDIYTKAEVIEKPAKQNEQQPFHLVVIK
ncbi:uncharacterized protein LOC114518688 [Dendronephthya gigantea]|uniref:uncharacterized protein LOC114518688 n=1 Tax=Dendronephthya gigantea TaxID=151771 RepID=UPI00106D455E|nr:uncharacterized protein LOC114518688 [Dendronephthya gigantea]